VSRPPRSDDERIARLEAELEKLRSALREGRERWHEVAAADGAMLVDLGQVVYLRVDSDEHRVGF